MLATWHDTMPANRRGCATWPAQGRKNWPWTSKEALALDLLMELAAPHIAVATELLVGPVYFRLMFGGELSQAFAERIVDALPHGYIARSEQEGAGRG